MTGKNNVFNLCKTQVYKVISYKVFNARHQNARKAQDKCPS